MGAMTYFCEKGGIMCVCVCVCDTEIAAGVSQQGGRGGEAPCAEPPGGLGGAVSPPTGSRGGTPGSYRFSVILNPFECVLCDVFVKNFEEKY